jgi:hypothetical protein
VVAVSCRRLATDGKEPVNRAGLREAPSDVEAPGDVDHTIRFSLLLITRVATAEWPATGTFASIAEGASRSAVTLGESGRLGWVV